MKEKKKKKNYTIPKINELSSEKKGVTKFKYIIVKETKILIGLILVTRWSLLHNYSFLKKGTVLRRITTYKFRINDHTIFKIL